jgi:CheY-like chemotaxis protein
MRALHKILVVDDDPVVGKSFNRVLTDKGYVVITAQNAQEALDQLKDGGFDAVFTDIRMPGMDGLELAEHVKAKQPWTPVVIVTGYGTEANEARAKAAGVTAFLRKPLSPEMIEESTTNALLEPAPIIVPQAEASPAEKVQSGPVEEENNLQKILLLMAAPFIGLAFAVLFPIVGLGILIGMGIRAFATLPMVKEPLTFLKNVALFAAAPFIGLAYVVLFPFVGTAMLAWFGVKALTKKRPVA